MGSEPDDFEHRVRRVIESIAPGDVMAYGEVAAEVGRPGAARSVGRILSRSGGSLPWWRVVNASGRLVPGNEIEHAKLLATEGVEVRNGRVRRLR